MSDSGYAEFEEYLQNESLQGNLEFARFEPLSAHCTFRIGGPADFAVWPFTVNSLIGTIEKAEMLSIKNAVLGNGSNLICSDRGYRGAAIFTTKMSQITSEGRTITALSGASFSALSMYAAKCGLSGLEFAYGIPGTVGGAVYMNAGAYDHSVSDVLTKSTYCLGGKTFSLSREEHEFSYRHSIYTGKRLVILSADFELTEADPVAVRAQMDDYMQRRREKQPLEYPSAGSVFKRCTGHYTSRLIEQAGLKGLTIGGAQVSEKHAGFIINRKGATANDVLRLIAVITAKIKEQFGVDIESEVIYFGEI